MFLSFNDSLKLKIFSYAKTAQYEHFKNRSDFTEHTKQNNKDLTPVFIDQIIRANYG